MYLPQRLPGQEWLGVVIALPEPWVSVLTDIRVSLGDDQGTKVPAHITILPPTAVDMERREEVIEHLRSVAQRYTPFRVTLGDTGTFRPVSPVVYLSLAEGERECTMLAEDIRSGPLDAPARLLWFEVQFLISDLVRTILKSPATTVPKTSGEPASASKRSSPMR